jgi:hypothetical protein
MIINDLRLYKIESVRKAQNQPAQQENGQAVEQQTAMQQQAQQQAPFPPNVDANGNPQDNDDLPF